MTKQQKIFALISVSVILIAALALIKPIGNWISNKQKYADFNESLDGFYVTGWNFGWEMPNGTYKAGVRVSDFSILVEEK